MRKFSILFYLFTVFYCFSEDQMPVLTVDDQHFRLLHTNTPDYQMQPCRAVILDATHYTFNMSGLIRGKQPTKIFMIGAVDVTNVVGVYQLDWEPGKTRYEISGATLTPITPSEFVGFKAGQRWIISIDANYEANKALAAWYGAVEVR